LGYPTKTLRDIINNREEIQREYPSVYYAFILYKNEHIEFKNYILRNFNRFDRNSPNVLFFLLDYPADWFDNYRRRDHVELHGKDYQYQLNDEEVDKVIEHFGIKNFKLPLVITFKSLHSFKTSVFSLSNVQDNDFELDTFFLSLYRPLVGNEDYYERSQLIHRQFPNIPSEVVTNPNQDRMYMVFEKIIDVIEFIRDEDIEQYPELGVLKQMLETILYSFLESKEVFKEKIILLEKALAECDSVETEIALEKVRQEVDNELYVFQQKIKVGSKTLEELLGGRQFFMNVFEKDSSLSMIRSALLTEEIVLQSDISDYDYSLCAVGFWKALEIELNIVVADAIRMLHRYINSIPSYGRTLKKKNLLVSGLRQGKVVDINVNEVKDNKVKDLMFGPMLQLMDYAEENRYKEILEEVTKHLKTIDQQQQFKMNLLKDLREIVYEYRNKGSHTSHLNKQDLQNIKEILLKQNGLFHRIAKIKSGLLEKSSVHQVR
jgi:hypothetical protein